MPDIPDPLDEHFKRVTKAIIEARLVPFLGAGASLFGRPEEQPWKRGEYLPDGKELAEHLVRTYGYPGTDPENLARVSQYLAATTGSGALYDELHQLLDVDYPPTRLHNFLAILPSILREKGHVPPYPLFVTTNYDDALERAFHNLPMPEPFDLVWYLAEGDHRGKFYHLPPTGEADTTDGPIDKPNEYRRLSFEQRTVILKIHGAVDRAVPERDSYVITEDHYIDYLTRTDIASLLPVPLPAKLRKSHFLFLGYSLRDWNLRVILHRIWGERKLTYQSWAVQRDPDRVDEALWGGRGVEIIKMRLEDYLALLERHITGLPARQGSS